MATRLWPAAAFTIGLGLAAFAEEPSQQTARDLYRDALPHGAIARLGTLRLRHMGGASAVAFSPDGNVLASGGSDHRLHSNLKTGALEADTVPTSGHSVYGVAFSPSGGTLAIASGGQVLLWNRAARKEVRSFPAFLPFPPFGFSPDGRLLAVATSERAVTLYDVSTGRERAVLAPGGRLRAIVFSPDGRRVALANGTHTIHLWNVVDQSREPLTVADANLNDAAFAPDGSALATSGAAGDSTSNHAIWIWEMPSRRLRVRIRLDSEMVKGRIVTIAFSPSGATVASGTGDGRVRIWDARTGLQRRQIDAHRGAVENIAFSPDGKHLASASSDGAVGVWNVATGAPLIRAPSHRSDIKALAFSRDSRRVVSGSADGTARLWEVATGTQIHELSPHTADVTAVALAESAGVIVSGTWDTLHFWDLATGALRLKSEAHKGWVNGMAAFPDGRTIVTGGDKDGLIRFWDAATGRMAMELEGQDISDLAASADGETLVSGARNGELRVWRRENGNWRSTVVMRGSALRPRTGVWESASSEWVTAVAISRDGRTIAAGGYNGSLSIWNAATGRRIREVVRPAAMGRNTVHAVALSIDGALLAWYAAGDAIVITEVATGRTLTGLRGHRDFVRALAFAPDGRHLAAGSRDGLILIWDLRLLSVLQ